MREGEFGLLTSACAVTIFWCSTPVSCWMPVAALSLRSVSVNTGGYCNSVSRAWRLLTFRRCYAASRQKHSQLALTRYGAPSLLLHSVFGEDALVNVSVEKKDDNDGKLAGYIRIRSKTQGIALSLGDRITSVQRGMPEPAKQ